MSSLTTGHRAVDLYWIPLGAGGRFVRFNGRVFEAIVAHRERRAPQDLYHSALEVILPEGRWVIEQAWPIPEGAWPRAWCRWGRAGWLALGRPVPFHAI